jgi:hypothetical protein
VTIGPAKIQVIVKVFMNKGTINYQPNRGLASLTILQRIAKREKTAVKDCIETYGSLVWFLAKKFTYSPREAEETALKVFKDIWTCAELYNSAKCTEEKYILRIALPYLFRHLGEKNH